MKTKALFLYLAVIAFPAFAQESVTIRRVIDNGYALYDTHLSCKKDTVNKERAMHEYIWVKTYSNDYDKDVVDNLELARRKYIDEIQYEIFAFPGYFDAYLPKGETEENVSLRLTVLPSGKISRCIFTIEGNKVPTWLTEDIAWGIYKLALALSFSPASQNVETFFPENGDITFAVPLFQHRNRRDK